MGSVIKSILEVVFPVILFFVIIFGGAWIAENYVDFSEITSLINFSFF